MMRRATTPRPAFVHIGASKTGTSALQRGLWDSVDQLGRAGVGVPLPGRPAHVRKLLRPLGWVTGAGFVRPIDHDALGRLARRLRSTPGDRLLLSNEDLCEANPEQIEAVATLADRAGLEISVVLTLRNLASVLPSEWQQFLKHRLTTDYPTFLAQVRDREGPAAAHFWQRQDAVAIGERWSVVTGPDRFHVIVVPPMQQDPDAVFRLFGEVVGFPPDALQLPDTDVNASLGYVEAEVYRRLNASLGRRLSDLEKDYQPAVRRILLHGVLARGASDRITLPPEHVAWVRDEAHRQRQGLLDAGFVIHGAIDRLVPAEDVGRPLPELREADVANAAVATLANFAVQQHRSGDRKRGGRRRRFSS